MHGVAMQTRFSISLLILGLLVSCSNSDKRDRPDFGVEEDGVEPQDGSETKTPVVSIDKPSNNQIISGIVTVSLNVQDPLGKGIGMITYGFKKGKDVIQGGQVKGISGTGIFTFEADTKVTKDGIQILWCVVETIDHRQGQGFTQVLVDNTLPTVGIGQGSTLPDSNFMGNIEIVPCFDDGAGSGVVKAMVGVGDNIVKTYEKVKNGCQPKVIVPTNNYKPGNLSIKIEAFDGAGHTNSVMYKLNFVPPPKFYGATAFSLQHFDSTSITGLKVLDKGMVAVAGHGGVYLLHRVDTGDYEQWDKLITENPSYKIIAGDLNNDKRDDLIVLEEIQGKGRFLTLYLQDAKGKFSQTAKAEVDAPVNDIAFGDINDDGYADIALALDKDSYSLGIILSKVVGGVAMWGGIENYGGVPKPSQVGIGNFTPDNKKDILLARSNLGMLTLFKFDPNTGLPEGGLNFEITDTEGNPLKSEGFSHLTVIDGLDKKNPNAAIACLSDLGGEKVFLIRGEIDPGKPLGFYLLQTIETGNKSQKTIAGYIDGDKNPDLIVLSEGSNMVISYFGDQGKLIQGPSMAGGGKPKHIALSDVDNDGYLDVVVSDETGKKLTTILFDGTQYLKTKKRRFLGVAMVMTPWQPLGMGIGVFAPPIPGKKGLADLAVLGMSKDNKYEIKFWVSDGFLPVDPAESGNITCQGDNTQVLSGPVGLIARDIDLNGSDDLIIPTNMVLPSSDITNPGTLLVIKLNPKTSGHKFVSSLEKTFINAGESPTIAHVDLLDGDNKPDLAVISKFEGEFRVQPFINKNDTFVKLATVKVPLYESKKPVFLTSGKLFEGVSTKEDYTDLIIVNEASGDISVFFGLSGGAIVDSKKKHFAVGQSPKACAIARLDGPVKLAGHENDDLLPDVVTLLSSDVAISYATKIENQWTLEPPVLLGHKGQGPVALAVEDMNLDGYYDILVLNQQESTIYIYINLANRKFSQPFVFSTGIMPTNMIVKDMNGDVCPDVGTMDKEGRTITLLVNYLCLSE